MLNFLKNSNSFSCPVLDTWEEKLSHFSVYMDNSRQAIILARGLNFLENFINEYTKLT